MPEKGLDEPECQPIGPYNGEVLHTEITLLKHFKDMNDEAPT